MYQERKLDQKKTRPRFQVARVIAHTHIDIDMHIHDYVKFHFHLHLQSYLSIWHIIYVVNYIHNNINVQHLLFAGVRTAVMPAPDQPEPSSPPTRASRPKRSVPHSCPPERMRPLIGADFEAAHRSRERRPRRFLVHATAPCSNVAISGHNMQVKSSWESVLQLAVLPQLVNLFH